MEIWHNPRCSKSRQALSLIEESGEQPEVRRYLDDPPNAAELDAVITKLGLEPWEIARMGEPKAKELGLAGMEHDREAWIELLVANPILIERPIVIAAEGAVVGRPPGNVSRLLGG